MKIYAKRFEKRENSNIFAANFFFEDKNHTIIIKCKWQ